MSLPQVKSSVKDRGSSPSSHASRAFEPLAMSSLVSESIGTERASLSRVFVRLKLCCWPDPYTRQVTS